MTTSHLPSARVGSKPRALPGEALELVREVALEPPDHCYPWPFGKDRLGYGRVFYQGKTRPAHRVAWELHHGIVMGVEFDACHQPMICHDRSCINPLHIRPGTRAENMADCDIDALLFQDRASIRRFLRHRSLNQDRSALALAVYQGTAQWLIMI